MRLNQPAPDFELPDLQGNIHTLSQYRGRVVVLNFWSAECPYSVRTDELLLKWRARWGSDVTVLAVAMNRNESIEMVKAAATARGNLTVLNDANLAVTDLYGVEVTPHIHIIDRAGILRYRGAVDDVTFRQRVATRFFLEEAVEALLAGKRLEIDETPAYGCAIVREI
ncbi:MAG: redoxin domain-containing protein [Chloroflexota bacterium]